MSDPNTSSSPVGGIVLIISSLLSVAAMAHHPSVTAPDIGAALQQLKAMEGLSGWVHGILIALMLVNFYVLVEFCLERGITRPLVRAGLIAYAAGVVAMIGAASVSGWITPKVAWLVANPTDRDLHVMSLLINFSGTLNRTMADVGAVAMSAGIFFWSLGLMHNAGAPRLVGLLGLLVGILPAAGLVLGLFHLNVQGMMAVVALQGLWMIALGVLLILGRARA